MQIRNYGYPLLVDVVVSINGGPGMKPLEEYMLFTKQGSETVRATIPAGVRSAQCAVFHAQPRGLEPPRNDSVGRDRAWVEDPPERILYKSQYSGATQEEQGAGTYIFIVLCCVFVSAVIGCIYEVWRSARKDRRRRRASTGSVSGSGGQRWQPQQYTESLVTTTGVKTVGFKNVNEEDKRPNGTHAKVAGKEYKPVPNAEPKDVGNDKRVHIKDEEPEKKELLGVNTGIVTKPPKPNPFSMEDLREEPELEEREEEEVEEEEDDEEDEPEVEPKEETQNKGEETGEASDAKLTANIEENSTRPATRFFGFGRQSKSQGNSPPDPGKPYVLNLQPIYLSEDRRTFANPISYLGGPRLQPRNKSSIESIMSLD